MSEQEVDKRTYYLLKDVNKAIRDYAMIADGDRIAVAVSGGKDSLSLVHLLQARQSLVQEMYEIIPIHVQKDESTCIDGQPADPAPLLAHLERLDLDPVAVEMEPPSGKPRRANQSPCFHCAWRRRKAIFQAADRAGCNKVAFGHHTDDLAQTTLLNVFFHGRAETMEPRVSFFDGRFIVVRPLAYVREKEIARFAESAHLPTLDDPCVGSTDSQRELMQAFIKQVANVNPKVRINLLRVGLEDPRI
jgi:tRNA 2-thiocytidine biosynthesis protein TtcA